MEEMLLLTKHLRFYYEYSTDYKQQLTPIPEDAIVEPVKANRVPAE